MNLFMGDTFAVPELRLSDLRFEADGSAALRGFLFFALTPTAGPWAIGCRRSVAGAGGGFLAE